MLIVEHVFNQGTTCVSMGMASYQLISHHGPERIQGTIRLLARSAINMFLELAMIMSASHRTLQHRYGMIGKRLI